MIHELPNNYIAVQVPEGITSINPSIQPWLYEHPEGHQYLDFGDAQKHFIHLPSGQWQLIGLADAIGEDVAGDIASAIDNGGVLPDGYGGGWEEKIEWFDYVSNVFNLRTALQSFKSLLSSLALNPSTTIILKRV